MKIEALARLVVTACETEEVDHMLTGAFAVSFYGIPRSTKDVDFVLSLEPSGGIGRVIERLNPEISFQEQIQFDTATWGRRHIGEAKGSPVYKVELFELFDDPFVVAQFERRTKVFSSQLEQEIYLPTPEDVLVQKLRWARPKDLEDARDILAVQQPQNLDMEYVENWCREHGSSERLKTILEALPEI